MRAFSCFGAFARDEKKGSEWDAFLLRAVGKIVSDLKNLRLSGFVKININRLKHVQTAPSISLRGVSESKNEAICQACVWNIIWNWFVDFEIENQQSRTITV